MYPIFITDDPQARVEIPSLPGQCRWGVERLEEFIGPLVKKGLKSVILFGVPLTCPKVRICASSYGSRTSHRLSFKICSGHPKVRDFSVTSTS